MPRTKPPPWAPNPNHAVHKPRKLAHSFVFTSSHISYGTESALPHHRTAPAHPVKSHLTYMRRWQTSRQWKGSLQAPHRLRTKGSECTKASIRSRGNANSHARCPHEAGGVPQVPGGAHAATSPVRGHFLSNAHGTSPCSWTSRRSQAPRADASAPALGSVRACVVVIVAVN